MTPAPDSVRIVGSKSAESLEDYGLGSIDSDDGMDEEPQEWRSGVEKYGGGYPVESFASNGEYTLVGHGQVARANCGTFNMFYGCIRKELHNIIRWNSKNSGLENLRNKGYFKRVLNTCHRSDCPVCYKVGWAVREATNMENRLAQASKRWGPVEHIIASVPAKDYGLGLEASRKKVVRALVARGVIGGGLIVHHFRYNDAEQARRKGAMMGWYFSPHWHVLGFIQGGYRCRGCHSSCYGCDGFKSKVRQQYAKDGYVVKVKGKRKTVGGTAWYQLNHASVKAGATRFHVATWFGVCSYRKLKVMKADVKKPVCPICGHELVHLRYFGSHREEYESRRDGLADIEEDGREVWVVVEDKWNYS